MEDERYEIKVRLAGNAWSNANYYKDIESGELEKMAQKWEGFERLLRGDERGKYQNTFILKGTENAFELMKKLNKLSYVCEVKLVKEDLKSRQGYIPIQEK